MADSLRILFITPSYKPAFVYGGPTVSVSQLAEALVTLGHFVTVYTTTANGKVELDVPVGKSVNVGGVEVIYFHRLTKDHTHISIALWQRLNRTLWKFDVVHLHSWWSILILGCAAVLKRQRRKFILSPRGMLGVYSFEHQHSRIKRWIHYLIGKNLLRYSTLHATTLLEWNDCQRVLPGWRGFVLHNLVQLPQKHSVSLKKNEVFTIGFLSRIDPKKGLEILFEALSVVSFPFQLQIAGGGNEDYINELKKKAGELALSPHIKWCGWKAGEEKFLFLEGLDLFALTSYNENFAIAVVEALAVGTPVLVSQGVGLADYVKANNVGWVAGVNSISISKNLEEAALAKNFMRGTAEQRILTTHKDFDSKQLAAQYLATYKQWMYEQ